MFNLWTKRIVISSLFAMVGSLYIAVGTQCAPVELKDKPAETPTEDIAVSNTEHLKEVFKQNDFNLDKAVESELQIPRTYVANFPQDLPKVKDRKLKKELFVNVLLPMILHENEIINKERKHLLELKKMADAGKTLKHSDTFWLNKVCEKYKMTRVDFPELLRRVDIIPPSLALGQATIESGMGLSYAAIKKHSPFGMTVSQKVKAYKNLSESVSAYVRNLNSNNAYKTMRKTRAELRAANKDIDGNVLIGDLLAYCEKGQPYIKQVRSAIKSNDLMKYDSLNLEPKDKA